MNDHQRTYAIRATVSLYAGDSACWHFATLPKKQSEEIRLRFGAFMRGWGSLPVHATIGKTIWRTSIFLDRKAGAFLLPLNAAVRKREGIRAGDRLEIVIDPKIDKK
jgi:hypothetical protein